MAEKRKNIYLDTVTYNKLSELKKGYSFNTLINAMATFFRDSKIDPVQVGIVPSIEFKKDMDRIIRILKAQEKEYKKLLHEQGEYLKNLYQIFQAVDTLKEVNLSSDELKKHGLSIENLHDINEELAKGKPEKSNDEKDKEQRAKAERILYTLKTIKEDGGESGELAPYSGERDQLNLF